MDEIIKERIRKFKEQYGIPTAKKGAPLFQSGVNELYIAAVYPSNDLRALGFKRAADILVDTTVNEPGCADEVVYSICYLYRLYIEVRLKSILEVANQISEDDYHHNLDKLWGKVNPIIKKSSQFFDDGELEAVKENIQEFDRIDPFSDAFRYSTNKNNKPTLSGMETVDLIHLKQVIHSLSMPLEGSFTAIYEGNKY